MTMSGWVFRCMDDGDESLRGIGCTDVPCLVCIWFDVTLWVHVVSTVMYLTSEMICHKGMCNAVRHTQSSADGINPGYQPLARPPSTGPRSRFTPYPPTPSPLLFLQPFPSPRFVLSSSQIATSLHYHCHRLSA